MAVTKASLRLAMAFACGLGCGSRGLDAVELAASPSYVPDASVSDATVLEASAFEASAPDAGPVDAASVDADVADAAGTLAIGLIAHYTFDEGDGSILVDHSGNKHDGVITFGDAGLWLGNGKFGGALHFGGGDFVTVDAFPSATSSFSVSAWVRSSAGHGQFETVLSTEIGCLGGWEVNMITREAGVFAHFAYYDPMSPLPAGAPPCQTGSYTVDECPCIQENQWVHVTSVLDGSSHTLSLYIGESLSPTGALVGVRSITKGTPALSFGKFPQGPPRFLTGDVDDVAIYTRALTPDEVRVLAQRPPPDP
jgi:Concanavalin A-like lectin/glucanases superfamily